MRRSSDPAVCLQLRPDYCWGGGVYWYNKDDPSKPGKPTPIYQTVVEANADASAWGDELLAGGYEFAGALHTGFMDKNGGGPPSTGTVVTAMSDDLLVGVFVPEDAAESALEGGVEGGAESSMQRKESIDPHSSLGLPSAYLFIVDKRVSGQVGKLPARNVTLTLHRTVGGATVVPPGVQGARGFDELRARHGVRPPAAGKRRSQYSHVGWHQGRSSGGSILEVTVELVGGGGALVRLSAAAGSSAVLLSACFAMCEWVYEPGSISMNVHSPSMNFGLKAPSWAYDSWHARYRPYEGLERTAGKPFEDGEQTAFIIGASFLGASPPTTSEEAQAWAWAGYNLLSLEAPSAAEVKMFGPAAAMVGAVLDGGYTFGYFVALEPSSHVSSAALSPMDVVVLNKAFRCHGRWAGLTLARLVNGSKASMDAAVAAAASLRTFARGSWLLPLTTTTSAKAALELGQRGVPLSMPSVPSATSAAFQPPFASSPSTGPPTRSSAVAWAQAVVGQYEPMRAMLAASYYPVVTNQGETRWQSDAPMPFVAAVDACASDSDSMLRWSAFAALAYGARGLYWQGAAACAPLGSPKFNLLASINKRIAQWGNTFVADQNPGIGAGGGYNVTRMWSSGFALPHAVAPGSGGPGDLVQAADPEVLVVQLHPGDGRSTAIPLVYVVDQRVDHTPGAAMPRTIRVQLREDVTGTQPLEGDCTASRCQCNLGNIGNVLTIQLPGGSGQLVALGFFVPGVQPH